MFINRMEVNCEINKGKHADYPMFIAPAVQHITNTYARFSGRTVDLGSMRKNRVERHCYLEILESACCFASCDVEGTRVKKRDSSRSHGGSATDAKTARSIEGTIRSELAKGNCGILEGKPAPILTKSLAKDFLPFTRTRCAGKPKTLAYY
jgi:hypothetical protein